MKHTIDKHDSMVCAYGNKKDAEKKCSSDRDKAIKQAKLALSKMKTKGWTIHVFENLGWHWEIINQTAHLSDGFPGSGKYHCYISDTPGMAFITWESDYYTDPNKAFIEAVRNMRAEKEEVVQNFRKMEDILTSITDKSLGG